MFLLNRALGWLGARPTGAALNDVPAADGLSVSWGMDEYDELEPDPTTEEMSTEDGS